jgi:K+ transporter
VGKPFDAKIHLAGDVGNATDATTRALLVRAFILLVTLFLIGSAGMGVYSGEFGALQAVWSVAGPLYGAMGMYFFNPNRRD